MKKKYKNLPPIPVDIDLKDVNGYMKEYDEILKEQAKLLEVAVNDVDKMNKEKLQSNCARMSEISALLWYLGVKKGGFIDEWYDN